MEELQARFTKALNTCCNSKVFWSKTNCRHKWKLQIYNAVIVAQLTYGLNTLQLTEAMLNRLDAFQMRGMRYITKAGHAYFTGISNEEVVKRVEIALNKGQDLEITWEEFIDANRGHNLREFKKLSDLVMERQNGLLGHMIRHRDDIMSDVTLTRDVSQYQVGYKRV